MLKTKGKKKTLENSKKKMISHIKRNSNKFKRNRRNQTEVKGHIEKY